MFGTGQTQQQGGGSGLQGYELFRQAQQNPELLTGHGTPGTPGYQPGWNELLAPFGQQVNMHPEANPIFHQLDTGQGFIGHHPGIFGHLQNALLGAALTQSPVDAQGRPVASGAGAGIARALQGGMAVRPYLENYIGQRFMAPFTEASSIAGLKFPEQYMNIIQNAANDRTSADLARIGATAPRINPVTGATSSYDPHTGQWGPWTGGFPHGKVKNIEETLAGPLVTFDDGFQTIGGHPYTGGALPIPKNDRDLGMIANTPNSPYRDIAEKTLEQDFLHQLSLANARAANRATPTQRAQLTGFTEQVKSTLRQYETEIANAQRQLIGLPEDSQYYKRIKSQIDTLQQQRNAAVASLYNQFGQGLLQGPGNILVPKPTKPNTPATSPAQGWGSQYGGNLHSSK